MRRIVGTAQGQARRTMDRGRRADERRRCTWTNLPNRHDHPTAYFFRTSQSAPLDRESVSSNLIYKAKALDSTCQAKRKRPSQSQTRLVPRARPHEHTGPACPGVYTTGILIITLDLHFQAVSLFLITGRRRVYTASPTHTKYPLLVSSFDASF